ncbi:MAG: radical SAM protein [Bacillota bacterium]|nr:radical SAM protein [Bacillota bacterium]
MNRENELKIIDEHPCFHRAAARWFGRIHLPVAPACNIQCRYCTRIYDCANENRPGVASHILNPREALQVVSEAVEKDRRLRVVGIAGPGDPLANPATLETLGLVHERFPHLIKCISTNGLLLEECLPRLKTAGVKAITVTVNAVCVAVGSYIYDHVSYRGEIYRGNSGIELLLQAQQAGIRKAVEMGMVVKINTVYIPRVNDYHLIDVARAVKAAGAQVMNVLPLIPQAEFAGLRRPGREEIRLARKNLACIIRQIDHCRQCRSDAVGMLC